MAAVTTASIIERAGILLDDMTHVGWTEDELLKWLNDGQREIVHFKPEANSKTAIVSKGRRHQADASADGVALIDISRNFAADGTTPGRAVRPVKRAQLDKNLPDWHNAAATLDAALHLRPAEPGSSMSIRRRTLSENLRSSMAQARQMQRWWYHLDR